MTGDLAFERLREANPVPESIRLEEASLDHAVLLTAITERTNEMQTQENDRMASAPPGGPRLWLVAAAVGVVLVAVGVIGFLSQSEETAGSTQPSPETDATPLPVLDEWVDAMNRGDLEGALVVLSPEASCDLPPGTVDTCEDHLGYLIAIGTHFEKTSCRESPPYRCNFDLTSQLHATMGYPSYSLPMNPEVGLDDEGLLVADFFGNIPVAKDYIPSESADIWAFMRSDYPELNIGLPFGPDPYTAEAGQAAMEAAQTLNNPGSVVEQLRNILGVYAASGLQQCTTQDGNRTCSDLVDFLEVIGATLELDCDIDSAFDGQIPCALTVGSDIHQALGSGPSTGDMTIHYRGGRAQALSFDLWFASDPAVHDAFIEYAESEPGLFTESSGRPVWTSETGPAWVQAAQEFMDGG